jgi:hypothetical protein
MNEEILEKENTDSEIVEEIFAWHDMWGSKRETHTDRDHLSKYEDIFLILMYISTVFLSILATKCTEGFIFKKHAFKNKYIYILSTWLKAFHCT